MSWMKRLGGRLPDFEEVVRRFPIAVIVMAIATVWLVVEIHLDDFRSGSEYVFGGFILAGYAAVIGHLIAETQSWTRLKYAILALIIAVPAFLFSAWGERLNFNIVLAVGAAILFLGNAAAWWQSRNDPAVWNFTQKLWTGAIFAAVGSAIFGAGMVIISEAVKALFGMNLEDLTIKTLLPIGLLFLAPVYWLGTLPRYGQAEDVEELSFEARALSFLGTWMLAPLVIIYAIIVLAYGAKVLTQWELPKGEIALLVSPFLGVGMLVWLMLEPKVLKESGFVRFYRAAWHWIMLPAAVLLGVAVFVRIRAFGFTPERFFLALVVIWAVSQSLWFTALPKIIRDIRIPTALAAGLLGFGAFGASPLSVSHQFHRAESAKAKLPALDAGSFKADPALARQFLGALKYIILNGDEKKFKRLLPDFEMPETVYGPDFDTMIKTLGLEEITDLNPFILQEHNLPNLDELNVPDASRVIFLDRLYLNPDSRFEGRGKYLSEADGYVVTYNLGDDRLIVDFETVVTAMYQANDDTAMNPATLTTEAGKSVLLYFRSGELSHQNQNLIRVNVSPVFILPN